MKRINSLLSAGVTLTSSGTAVAAPIPLDSAGYFPRFVRVVATGAGCFVKVGDIGVTAVSGDCMIQPLDGTVLNVRGCKAISAISVSGTSSVTVVPLEAGSWNYDQRTLDYNFTTLSAVPSTVTFTRASNATYFNSSGVLTTAGNNVARQDYDPVTLLPRGLLVEEQRTNLLLNSDVAGTNLATQSITVTAAPWTVSFTGTGTITFSGAYTGSLVGTGAATRVTSTFTPSAGSLTCTVTGTVKWAQAELGSFATSFIPTAGASATRSADSALMNNTNFSSWYNQTQGTFVVEYSRNETAGAHILFETKDSSGVTTDRLTALINSTNDPRAQVAIGGTVGLDSNGQYPSPVVGAIVKFALVYQSGSSATSRNGSTAFSSSATFTPVATYTRLNIGSTDNGTYGLGTTSFINGYVRRIQYYPTRLPNATLVTLTS